jgi:predicted phage terminase large subunit-like protein
MEAAVELAQPMLPKLWWFLQHEYLPHPYQMGFHFNLDKQTGLMCRNRHLVAGRRGGKTISAAEDVVYYAANPEAFHKQYHGEDSDRPLHIWILTKDYPMGMAALMAFRDVLKKVGFEHGREYKENRGNRWFEFENGSFVQFKTADDPESLRGAGLDILWIDEAAIIPTDTAWDVVRPALSDKLGAVITTTTPKGKNWFYHEFWGEKAMMLSSHGRIEYRSIDNPYFPESEWLAEKERMHPMLFAQEYMASFDSFAGKELHGDWLHYYERPELNGLELRKVIGVDPAISLADSADRFAISLIGVTKDNSQAYLLEQWAGKIPFPEQVELIKSWWQKFSPQYVSVEKVAYQTALIQQLQRLPGLPPISAVPARGKKFERILAMAPLFKLGRIKIRSDQVDFIGEWLGYDSTMANPEDDCLDSVEIALRGAGVVLPYTKAEPELPFDHPAADMEELRRRDFPKKKEDRGVDEHLGAYW